MFALERLAGEVGTEHSVACAAVGITPTIIESTSRFIFFLLTKSASHEAPPSGSHRNCRSCFPCASQLRYLGSNAVTKLC
jgi:hypothetical protein